MAAEMAMSFPHEGLMTTKLDLCEINNKQWHIGRRVDRPGIDISREVRRSRNSLLSIWRRRYRRRRRVVEVCWSMSWGRRWFHGKFLWKYNMNKLLVEKYGTRLHVHTLWLQSGGGGGRDAKATKLTLRIVVFWVERISCLSPVCRMRICARLDPVCCHRGGASTKVYTK